MLPGTYVYNNNNNSLLKKRPSLSVYTCSVKFHVNQLREILKTTNNFMWIFRTYVRIGRSRRQHEEKNASSDDDATKLMPLQKSLTNKASMSFLIFLLIRSSIMIDHIKNNEAHLSFIGCPTGQQQ